ncbi:hypothetical protein EniLVp02_0049 [Vibrio phage EniLVp02]
MNKTNVALVAILFLGVGCVSTQKHEPVKEIQTVTLYKQVELIHPDIPPRPIMPGKVEPLVITTDTIKPNVAYVGFEYSQWLTFAKFQHSIKNYVKNLEEAIEVYKAQDAKQEPQK